jgi:haloalkane dehalogenase
MAALYVRTMMEFDRRDVPSIGEVLRTPSSCFAEIVDYDWPVADVAVGPGLRMAYVDAGPPHATETVLLLHGRPMWGYLYRTMIPTLVAAGYRVIMPDLIGFGRSDKPVDPAAYTYSNHVAWVRSLVEHLDLGGVTFFGQDWRGLIGGRLIGEVPDRFALVVFSNTA